MIFFDIHFLSAVVSISAEPSFGTNLEEDMAGYGGADGNGAGGGEMDQESLRQSEEMMKAFMKATGGVEDETNKKERTKAIIKTIKVYYQKTLNN